MPDLREVYDMVTEQRSPAPGALERQRDRQHRSVRNRKLGAIAMSAALVVAAILVVVLAGMDAFERGTDTNEPADRRTVSSGPGAYLFDLDTGRSTQLGGIESAGHQSPWIAVSRDGSTVAYAANDLVGRLVIYVANADGTNVRPLERTARFGAAVGPAFSPDGSQIVFQAKVPPAGTLVGDVVVVDVATGATTRVADLEPAYSDLWYMGPHFGPDGQSIFFTSPRTGLADPGWDLWSVPVSGGTPELVLRGAIGGRISPDGRRIVYFDNASHGNGPRGDMWLADADGSNPQRVAGVQGDVFSARWSPDGTRIAYTDQASRSANVVDVTTGEVTTVLDDITDRFPEWVDDHTWIVGEA
jgi:Tol biopolymer transport system component